MYQTRVFTLGEKGEKKLHNQKYFLETHNLKNEKKMSRSSKFEELQ